MIHFPDLHPLGKDPKRCFDKRQRVRMFRRSGGCCEVKGCRRKIPAGDIWVAGHWPIPHALGGRTILKNSRVECSYCSTDTQKEDTGRIAKAKRQAGETGQQARRARRDKPLIQNRGFYKGPLKQKIGTGEVVPR